MAVVTAGMEKIAAESRDALLGYPNQKTAFRAG